MTESFSVKSSDRGFRELVHSSALSTGRSSGWNGTPVEVAGRAYGDPIRVRLDPQQFERDVLNALREGFSTETTSFFLNNQGRADDIFWRGGQRAFEFDAQLWLRNTVVLIDIKVNQRPLTFSQILSAFGRLSLMQRATDERVVMALIASGGFSDRAQSTLSLAPDFALISWQPSYGNERLVQAIEMLVSSRATDS